MDLTRMLARGAEGLIQGRMQRHQMDRGNQRDQRQEALLRLRQQALQDARSRRSAETADRDAQRAKEEEQRMTAINTLAEQLMDRAPEIYPDIEKARQAAAASTVIPDFDPLAQLEDQEEDEESALEMAERRQRIAESQSRIHARNEGLEDADEQQLMEGVAGDPRAKAILSSTLPMEQRLQVLGEIGYQMTPEQARKAAGVSRAGEAPETATGDPERDARALVARYGGDAAAAAEALENHPQADQYAIGLANFIRKEYKVGGDGTGDDAIRAAAGLD